MLNQFINICFMTISGTAQGVALEYMLETNNIKTKRWFRILYWTFLAIIPSIINSINVYAESMIIFRNILHWVFTMFALVYFYLGPIWRRILAAALLYIGLMSSDLSLLAAISLTDFALEEVLTKSSNISVFFIGLSTLVCLMSISIIVVLWRRVFYAGNNFKYWKFFALYILNHLGVFWLIEKEILTYELTFTTGLTGLTSTICAIVLMSVIFSQAEKEHLEKRLEETKHKNELERIHIQETKKRRDEISEISKKNVDEMLYVQNLLMQKKQKDAVSALEELLHRIEKTQEYAYCGIPIINTIISEKKNICDEKGIALLVNIGIIKEANIQQMDLCSIYSNLLDNAIRACGHVQNEKRTAEIKLDAAIKGEYLIIKCINTSAKVPGNKPEGTGYGLKILKDIATRYDGNLRIAFTENNYEAQISVKCS